MTLPQFNALMLEQVRPYILKITLNRPEVMNAINSVMMAELCQFWSDLLPNLKGIRCIILTGAGEKAFCAGADLKEREHLDLATWQQHRVLLQQSMIAMMDCPVPIIAAVNGVAYGGGLELALASDFIYAAELAVFAQPETKLGIMPAAMGTQNLPRACGLNRAKELCFTAESFSAPQAHEWGIVNQLCPSQQLLSMTLTVAEKIANNAPIAIQQAKKSLNVSVHSDVKSGYLFEVQAYNFLLKTKDREEGIRAFNQKRDPKFSGE